MTNNLHPENLNKPAGLLIAEAQKEMLAAIDRHFKNDGATGPTIRASIPAQWDDTDVIVMDALRVAKEAAEQRNYLLAAAEVAVDTILWMSGSDDFGPEGKAREGWLRVQKDINDVRDAITKAKGGQS